MGLIKATDAPVTLQAFSMKDIESHARSIILRAQQQAEQLLAEAQAEGEALKARAVSEGSAEGRKSGVAKGTEEGKKLGLQQALSEHRAQFTNAIKALTAAAQQIDASREELDAAAKSEIIHLAVSIARRVTKRQGSLDASVMTDNVHEAMKLVVQSTDLRIAVHPQQKQTLDDALPRLQLAWPKLQHVQVIEDATLAPGGSHRDGSRAGQEVGRRIAGGIRLSVFAAQLDAIDAVMPFGVIGSVQSISGLTIEASNLALPLGSLCRITSFGGKTATAEVIGFQNERTLLMPLSSVAGVARGDRIENVASAPRIWCSEQLLGRVINGLGEPIDNKGPLRLSHSRRIDGKSVLPLDRENIREPISTSIRCIDGLHTCGLGQRMGIFSGPGVGKSTLMSQIAKHTSADISVVALIGERGREVLEFIKHSLGEEGLKRCVVVVSTSDDAPLLRVRAAKVACTVAEYFRDLGKDVLLMMDSLTRMAQAQRQIGLAAKEPPVTKGLPPSVFSLIPEILERAGKTPTGSITGFYTVLVEGDDFNEPIPDCVKGITDGHFWLNRALANRNHFPAIDVIQSISRVRGDVTDKAHQAMARRVLSLYAIYLDIEDLVNIGAYVPGVNQEFDLAVQARPKIAQFLQQESKSPTTLEQAKQDLAELIAWIDLAEKNIKTQQAAKGQARPGGGAAR